VATQKLKSLDRFWNQ